MTSFFNPIETYWALFKRRWRKSIDKKAPDEANEMWMREELRRIGEDWTPEQIMKLTTCHFKEILEYLDTLTKIEVKIEGTWR